MNKAALMDRFHRDASGGNQGGYKPRQAARRAVRGTGACAGDVLVPRQGCSLRSLSFNYVNRGTGQSLQMEVVQRYTCVIIHRSGANPETLSTPSHASSNCSSLAQTPYRAASALCCQPFLNPAAGKQTSAHTALCNQPCRDALIAVSHCI
jgi:hypothetical protein